MYEGEKKGAPYLGKKEKEGVGSNQPSPGNKVEIKIEKGASCY